ncbi:MAG: helix-turn-helix domain-containing protein, partial [Hungatella hathewayi]
MREIPIDRIIVNLRKARGITQGELAGVMGVSKASVSKWETGSSYPDILLLPRLASYFQVSIDELMGYSPQMTEEEMRETFAKLADEFSEGNIVPVLEECRRLARDYAACFPVLLRLALFYVNCLQGAGEEYQE